MKMNDENVLDCNLQKQIYIIIIIIIIIYRTETIIILYKTRWVVVVVVLQLGTNTPSGYQAGS